MQVLRLTVGCGKHGDELVVSGVESRVPVLMPLKAHRVKWLMYVMYVGVQSPHVGLVGKFVEWSDSSGVILVI
ncbi:hypothetical protein TNCV_2063831 [Trichonephila clavipes]|nr:hypothetical protein TNCV_2063831 [Trichonephila clavipes]